ncbi:MAG: adenylosuccinate synthase [Chloroflexi bacterium AL-W]|nr:adenylosuccinate synthase [Chloroflexi bacterium AL-W]
MPATIIIGAQWGDEGKGRAVDWLAARADVVARFSGGDNAGHTIYVENDVFKLHLVPSGILHPNAVNVLGNGTVINPVSLLKEMDWLLKIGLDVSPERLKISTRAHIITPAHMALDAAKEKALGAQAIGTTLRGIGPAYLDKTGRKGIRTGEMLMIEEFAETIQHAIEAANETLRAMGADPLDAEQTAQAYVNAAERLRPYLADTTQYLNQQLKSGANVLCEGAQGTLLDVDHGSYPFVTSSNPSTGGALTGLGFGPKYVERVIGVAKTFSTRVGGGPMPTEIEGDMAERLRGTGENFWDEYGTTTGRPRRVGWLDAVMLRYSCDVNGYTDLVLTKLDVLSDIPQLKIAVGYTIDGVTVDYPPSTVDAIAHAQPIYETFEGWTGDVSGVRKFEQLPPTAQTYINRISALCDVPVSMVSVGPERDQLIMRD